MRPPDHCLRRVSLRLRSALRLRYVFLRLLEVERLRRVFERRRRVFTRRRRVFARLRRVMGSTVGAQVGGSVG